MQAKSGGMQQGAISMATKVIQLVVQRVYKEYSDVTSRTLSGILV